MWAADFDRLIAQLFDAAVEPERWPRALESCSDYLDGAGTKIMFQDRKTGRSQNLSVRMHPEADRLYAEHYYKTNLFLRTIARVPAGALIPGWELVPREIYLRSEYYNDFLIPGEMCCPIGVVLAKQADVWAVITCGRSVKAGDFSDEHLERLRLLAPHLTRAADVTLRMSRAQLERNCSVEVLNTIGQAVLVVGGNGEIVFANRTAEGLVCAGEGLYGRRGKLAARDGAEAGRLFGLIVSAASRSGGSGGVMAVTRRPPRRPLSVHVAPLAVECGWGTFHGPAAIVFIADPDGATTSRQEQLRALFGLTPMEAAVALRIADGVGLKAAADHLGIAVTTARTHLQHVFEKTDTRRQSELVRLIAGSATG